MDTALQFLHDASQREMVKELMLALFFKGAQFIGEITPNGYLKIGPVCRNRDSAICIQKCSECDVVEAVHPRSVSFRRHFAGYTTLAAYNLTPYSTGPWIVLDLDAHKESDDPVIVMADARKLAMTAANLGFEPYFEISRSGKGVHIWIFFHELIEGWKLQAIGRIIVQEAEIKTPVEVFPKQKVYAGGSFPRGNMLRLPLNGVENIAQKRSAFVDYTKESLPLLDQIAVLREALNHGD